MKKTLIFAITISFSLCASAQWAKVYTTTADLTRELTPTAIEASQAGTPNITIDPSETFQPIDGFGHAITYAACYNLLKMSPEMRGELLRRTFSPTDGYGVSYVRISIGCNDFSSTEYTLCDIKGPDDNLLKNFALQNDETQYVIPILKEILAINPDLKIMGSPWTPPRWMKTNGQWTGGDLKSEYIDAYGEYFIKFIQAFEAEGIHIYSVTPQNEPLNSGNTASCNMVWTTEANFIKKSLAPKLHNAGLSTRIFLYDHNYDYDGKSDQNDYSYKIFNAIGTDFPGYDLIEGTAFHKYTGYDNDWQEMLDIYSKTNHYNMFSEASIGTWNNYNDLSASLARDMRDLVIQPMLGYCRGALVWNFVLDTNRGPNRPGGCQTCYGAVNCSPDGSTYTYTSHYYIMAHASLTARPGAVRVKCSGNAGTADDCVAAFQNSDGSFGLMIANTHNSSRTATVKDGDHTYVITVPQKSIVTATLGITKEQAENGNVEMPDDRPHDATPLYVSGTFNNWPTPGSDNTWLMDYNDGLYSATIPFEGKGRFCIYGRNWNPKYCWSTSDPTISAPIENAQLRLEGASDDSDVYYNLTGNHIITFDADKMLLSISAPGITQAIVATQDSAPAEYFDITGRRVTAPLRGIYIRRSGDDVQKVVL